jgi:hypothetical protein
MYDGTATRGWGAACNIEVNANENWIMNQRFFQESVISLILPYIFSLIVGIVGISVVDPFVFWMEKTGSGSGSIRQWYVSTDPNPVLRMLLRSDRKFICLIGSELIFPDSE